MFIRKDGCKGNPKNSSIRNVCGHTPSGYSISTILPLKSKKKMMYADVLWIFKSLKLLTNKKQTYGYLKNW